MYIESILKNGILLAQVLFNNGRSMYGVDSVEWRWMVIVSFLLFGILSFTGIENSPCEPALYQKKNSQVHFIKKKSSISVDAQVKVWGEVVLTCPHAAQHQSRSFICTPGRWLSFSSPVGRPCFGRTRNHSCQSRTRRHGGRSFHLPDPFHLSSLRQSCRSPWPSPEYELRKKDN